MEILELKSTRKMKDSMYGLSIKQERRFYYNILHCIKYFLSLPTPPKVLQIMIELHTE